MVRESVSVPVPPLLVALIVTFDTPGVEGVPEMSPVVVLTTSPAGSPTASKLVGLLVAVIWYENGIPMVPVAVNVLVMTGSGGGSLIVRERDNVPVPPAFVALNVTEERPDDVGVPDIHP